jgi:hypothetical protein
MTGNAREPLAAPSWLESALATRVAAPPALREEGKAPDPLAAFVSIMREILRPQFLSTKCRDNTIYALGA